MQKAFALRNFFRCSRCFISRLKPVSTHSLKKKIGLATTLFLTNTLLFTKTIFFDEPKEENTNENDQAASREKKIAGLGKLSTVFNSFYFF